MSKDLAEGRCSSTAAGSSQAPSVARFTPGPWATCGFDDFDDLIEITSSERHDSNKIPVAEVTIGYSTEFENEQRANARLIAAAPEMYEALDHVEALLSIVEPRSNKREYLATLGEVRAALAKAVPPTEPVELRKQPNTDESK